MGCLQSVPAAEHSFGGSDGGFPHTANGGFPQAANAHARPGTTPPKGSGGFPKGSGGFPKSSPAPGPPAGFHSTSTRAPASQAPTLTPPPEAAPAGDKQPLMADIRSKVTSRPFPPAHKPSSHFLLPFVPIAFAFPFPPAVEALCVSARRPSRSAYASVVRGGTSRAPHLRPPRTGYHGAADGCGEAAGEGRAQGQRGGA